MGEDANTSAASGDVPKGRSKNRGGEMMTPAQKALRDAAIVAALHAGIPPTDVAKDFGLTPRSVRRVHEAFKLRPTSLENRPVEIVERVLHTYEDQMRTFAMVAQDTLDRAPAVAIAALKGQADALEKYVTLLGSIGKLPDNLEMFRAETEMRRVGEVMLAKIQQLESGEISAVEAAEFFRSVVTSSTPLASYEDRPPVLELEAGEGG